ncbi:MAG: sugar phosphate nucleotidyltransferase [Myxococcota bacterium]
MSDHVYAVVLAGGSGTRFWPASRAARPKQLQPLAPSSDQPLIADTVRRLEGLCGRERIVIATGAHLLPATREALPTLAADAFFGEPVARNTAPCIGWVTRALARRDPDAVVVVVPSDQHVKDEARFLDALQSAVRSARTGPITTIGIEPSRPETGFGYIEMGEAAEHGARRVRRFVEKPDRATAERYLADGRFVWNAGIFVFRAQTMIDAIATHLPALSAGLDAIDAGGATGTPGWVEATARVFPTLPAVSIDHGVAEKTRPLHVVPATFGWSDLGSWETAWELADKDDAGNASPDTAVLVDARNNLVCDLSARRPTVALVGVEDLCVVHTDDAVLVMPRDRAQAVREVVAALRERGRDDLL